ELPLQTTPFIGRARELEEVTRLLATPDCRALTLIGPGGIGKTRLALEAAAAQAENFDNGVAFVPLVSVSSPDYLVSTIARTIACEFYFEANTRQQLIDYLSELHLLLVLDNFEHLLDGAEIVSEILAAAPGVKILTTSRERLHLTVETIYNVGGLDLHANGLPESEAARLFLQSARRLRPDFILEPDDTAHMSRICQLVGGMPLGILLAATWVQTLSLAEIAGEITNSLDFLETRMRDIPERQRSIRAVFDPLWRQLFDEERDVFKKTSVFWGGFTREAFEAVTGGSLRLLAALVDKSLVRRDDDGRYRMHELLLQYGYERFQETPEDHLATRKAHARYYARFLSGKFSGLLGERPQRALEAIDAEIENIREAWFMMAEQHMAAEIRLSAASLWHYSMDRFLTKEGMELFHKALEALEAVPDTPEVRLSRAILQIRLGVFYGVYGYGVPEHGKAIIEEGLATLRAQGDKEELMVGLINLASVLITIHGWTPAPEGADWDWSDALGVTMEGLGIARELGDVANIAYSLYHLSWIAFVQRKYQEAWEIGSESLALFRQSNNPWMISGAGGVLLGLVAESLGDYASAYALRSEALQIAKDNGNILDVGHHYSGLGYLAYLQKDFAEAARLYRVGIQHYLSVPGNKGRWAIGGAVVNIAKLWAEQGKVIQAVELLSLSHIKYSVFREKNQWINGTLETLKPQLTPEAYEAALERGRKMDLNVIVQDFLKGAESDNPGGTIAREPDALTEREREVVGLVAQGMSNREIAESLFFSVGTVKWYINQIFGKLRVSNRTQMVARAREMSLIP
ncbi:MAG: LuxR C-terminal-related transcriptional regulator, partial [Anaerolineae bacterium]|nr:LuxR C-terminal-related transcriptional regulator [Anaerolineae bacterium]